MCAFVVLGLVFFHTKPRDWLVEMSPKWPILCREGQNRNSSQSSNQFYCLCVVGTTMHEESWTKSTDKDLYISLRKSRATLLKLTAIVNKPLTDSFPACVVTETQRLTVYCRADFPVDFSFFWLLFPRLRLFCDAENYCRLKYPLLYHVPIDLIWLTCEVLLGMVLATSTSWGLSCVGKCAYCSTGFLLSHNWTMSNAMPTVPMLDHLIWPSLSRLGPYRILVQNPTLTLPQVPVVCLSGHGNRSCCTEYWVSDVCS